MSNQEQKPEVLKVEDDSEKSIVQRVMEDRNFSTGAGMLPPSAAPIHHTTELGNVRIEGEVTDTKLALARPVS